LSHAQAGERALEQRLHKAQQALEALTVRKQGKERFSDIASLQQAADQILVRYAVAGLLGVQVSQQVQERQVRAYGDRPAETRSDTQLLLQVRRHPRAIEKVIRRLGWRVYGTNCPRQQLSLSQAVLAYREEYLVEHCFGRLKGKPLSLTPMYLEDDRHATGLTRLLTIGLRLLTLLEHRARTTLAQTGDSLAGLYAGNPTRSTDHPTTEALLRAFKNLYLNFVTLAGHDYLHLTPLSDLQHKILGLLDLPPSLYTRLEADSANPPSP
jgi:transposase